MPELELTQRFDIDEVHHGIINDYNETHEHTLEERLETLLEEELKGNIQPLIYMIHQESIDPQVVSRTKIEENGEEGTQSSYEAGQR